MIVPQRLVKTARELGAMREAGHLLSDICDGAHAFIKQGRKEYEIIADIDRLARDKGAEDIRILAGDKTVESAELQAIGDPQPSLVALFGGAARTLLGRGGADFYFVQRCATSSARIRKTQKIVAQMAAQLKPGGAVAAIDETARRALGEFYATASMYGLGQRHRPQPVGSAVFE